MLDGDTMMVLLAVHVALVTWCAGALSLAVLIGRSVRLAEANARSESRARRARVAG